MRKLLFFFAAMLLMVSCSTGNVKMKALAMAANQMCPKQMDSATTLTEVEYGVGTLFYYYTIDEDIISLEIMDESLEQTAENLKAALELPEYKELVDACEAAHAEIHWAYKGLQSGNGTMGFTIDPISGHTTFYHLKK